MQGIKRWGLTLALIAVVLSAMLLVFGCSQSNSTPSNDTKDAEKTEAAAEPVTLQIYAANSLQKALPEVQSLYTKNNPEVTFADTQFEASNTLVEKLNSGGTADMLICASTGTMDTAEKNGSVDTATRKDMFSNELVVAVKSDSNITINSIEELATNPEITSIAIGEPNTVPAGKYACETLESAGLCTIETAGDGKITVTWDDSIKDKINAGADKVGTVASYVSEGQATVGFVYTSDIYRYQGIKVGYTTPADSHKAIKYPGAICTSSTNPEIAKDFMDFCQTDPEAQKIFSEYGFELL